MDYKKIYDSLVAKRRENHLTGYVERHHVLPKSMGGSDDKKNIVCLTGREHFVAHLLLARIYGGTMWIAVLRMKNRRGKDGYINSRLYEKARIEWSTWSSENQRGANHWAYGKVGTSKGKKILKTSGANHWNYGNTMPMHVKVALLAANTGKKRSDETKKKIGARQVGKNNHQYGKQMSEQHKAMLQKKMKDWFKNATPEQLKNRAKSRVGQKRSEESKAKMRESSAKRWAKYFQEKNSGIS